MNHGLLNLWAQAKVRGLAWRAGMGAAAESVDSWNGQIRTGVSGLRPSPFQLGARSAAALIEKVTMAGRYSDYFRFSCLVCTPHGFAVRGIRRVSAFHAASSLIEKSAGSEYTTAGAKAASAAQGGGGLVTNVQRGCVAPAGYPLTASVADRTHDTSEQWEHTRPGVHWVDPGCGGGGLDADELAAQFVAHQGPNLVHGIGPRDLPSNLGIEVLGAGAGRFTGNGEAVTQHQHAEGQQAQRGLIANAKILTGAPVAVHCGEVVCADNVRLDVGRRHTRSGQPLCNDLLFDGAVICARGFDLVHACSFELLVIWSVDAVEQLGKRVDISLRAPLLNTCAITPCRTAVLAVNVRTLGHIAVHAIGVAIACGAARLRAHDSDGRRSVDADAAGELSGAHGSGLRGSATASRVDGPQLVRDVIARGLRHTGRQGTDGALAYAAVFCEFRLRKAQADQVLHKLLPVHLGHLSKHWYAIIVTYWIANV